MCIDYLISLIEISLYVVLHMTNSVGEYNMNSNTDQIILGSQLCVYVGTYCVELFLRADVRFTTLAPVEDF